ncbi:tripartite tricarboxylate transporter TctB family protein [Thalassospira sp. TSL5-1]|uniref:tripartite tricarboxylate transporter TctB family protein n=1 Tax=Thalassospira sp. TSL5-1 TaxID=1544451 RepID=UPI00093B5B6F|nr:tripartite tricarboxylate transporter TctB family protein [Thalassospira sp. TSL5-1]OKH87479.1 membrane protein [Thalassospira sp. TSL5-1]
MSDRVLGVACLLLSAFYIFMATQIQTSFITDYLGPKFFPILIASLLAIAAIFPIIKPDPDPDWPGIGRLVEIVFAVAVMVAYTYALPVAGFVVSTAITAGILSWRLGAKPVAAATAGVSISVGIYVVFHLILQLSLARGPWGF